MTSDQQKKLLADYQKKTDELLYQMYQVLARAQRKLDDAAYRKMLLKINHA